MTSVRLAVACVLGSLLATTASASDDEKTFEKAYYTFNPVYVYNVYVSVEYLDSMAQWQLVFDHQRTPIPHWYSDGPYYGMFYLHAYKGTLDGFIPGWTYRAKFEKFENGVWTDLVQDEQWTQ